jgi:hypothetical protein
VLVVGGGLGGVAAALAAARCGHRVILTEQYTWLGGQLTSQAVPPDEHRWVEQFGVTRSYRELRNRIRGYYRQNYPLTERSRRWRELNPGAGAVSRLCHEPRVAVAVLDAMLAPYRSSRRLRVLQPCIPVTATADADRVTSVTLRYSDTGEEVVITAGYVLDATETGELLPMTGCEYVTGFESRTETGEPSAPETPQPLNMQAISVCFAVDHVDGNHVIDKPVGYQTWRCYAPPFWGGPMFSWASPSPRTKRLERRIFDPNPEDDPLSIMADLSQEGGDVNLWTFRRIAARKIFVDGCYESDITLVNWPMIDYFEGLAMAPYIRESRRIKALYTVVEQDLSLAVRGQRGAVSYPDSVGIGMYRIDLHPSTGGDHYLDIGASPFQIPLGALLPQRLTNLIAAGKNIGTTHITNGCYRLHPVEWNIGEVAGMLAAHCISSGKRPVEVRSRADDLVAFQRLLVAEGIELAWPKVSGY